MGKKVLIFFPHQLKQRHGGPYSMLYHLQQGLKGVAHNVDFLSSLIDFSSEQNLQATDITNPVLKNFIKQLLPDRWIYQRRIKQWLAEVDEPDARVPDNINLPGYDVLHFHETIDIWRYRKILENYKGQIVLTSHTPKPYHLELLEDVMKLTKQDIGKPYYKLLEDIDIFAYRRADHLLFPCQEAIEPYSGCWPFFKNLLLHKKVSYVTTGVVSSVNNVSPQTTRDSLNIPASAFVITFAGRKIPVKGYDLLLEAAEILLPLNPDLYFLVIGEKNEAYTLQHDRWVELGWTDAPFSYIDAGDLHVTPNRQSNFDLNVLEVLSLGKAILLSNTGGNKYFKSHDPKGIFYHEPNAGDLVKQLQACYQIKDQLGALGEENTELYKAHFTAERFAKDQVRFYNSIQQ